MKPLLIFLVAWLGLTVVHAHATDLLKLTKTIPLAGVKGRFDHFAADVQSKRLFVAALGNNTLEVIDLAAGKRLRSISGLHKPTGVVFLPEENQIGVANGDDGTFKMFDAITYQLVNNLHGLEDADNVRRDPKTKLIYVGYGDGALVVLDGSGKQRHADIKLPSHPESFQLEMDGGHIFVNVPDAKQIAVVDPDRAGGTEEKGPKKSGMTVIICLPTPISRSTRSIRSLAGLFAARFRYSGKLLPGSFLRGFSGRRSLART